MVTFTSHNPAETFALGDQWGRDARPGWVIGISGDLGTGKTQLVKGIAHGLGITTRIQSPTFALVNEHSGGRLPFAHLDLYRLDTPAQIIGAGLEVYFSNPPGVVVVEWCERWPDLHPKTALRNPSSPVRLVHIEQTADTERRITYEDLGG